MTTPTLDPAWWTDIVVSVAKTVIHDFRVDKMPILADALEDAGCQDIQILEQLRSSAGVIPNWVSHLAYKDGYLSLELDRAGFRYERDRSKRDEPILGVKFHTSRPPEDLRTLANIGAFQKLQLAGSRCSQQQIEVLTSMKRLQEFELDGQNTPDIREVILRWLGSLKQLRKLSFHYAGIRDEDLQYFSSFKKLRELSFNYTGPGGPGLQHLTPVKTLEVLHFESYETRDAMAEYLRHVPQIRTLRIPLTNMNYDFVRNLETLEKLERLELTQLDVSSAGLPELANRPNLQSLVLGLFADFTSGNCALNPEFVERLATLTQLRTLELSGMFDYDTNLEALTALENLEEATIYENLGMGSRRHFLRVHLGPLAGLKKLRVLRTEYLLECRGKGSEVLAEFPALEVLSLSKSDLDNDGLERLAKAKNLKELNIHRTRVTDEGLQHLSKLRKLQRLTVSQNRDVTDETIPIFFKMKKLTWLDLRGTFVTAKGAKELRAVLPKCKVLIETLEEEFRDRDLYEIYEEDWE